MPGSFQLLQTNAHLTLSIVDVRILYFRLERRDYLAGRQCDVVKETWDLESQGSLLWNLCPAVS